MYMYVQGIVHLPLAVASSPSSCAIRCVPIGATPTGNATFSPNNETLMSSFETSRNMRGRRRYLHYT